MAVDVIPASNVSRGFVRQVARLAGAYWSGPNKWKVCGQSLALLLLTVLQVQLSVWANYWNRALFDALEQRSIPELALQTGLFVVILLLTVGVTAGAWLTPRLHETDTWDRILPLRSQQRLAFARVLIHQPCWIFIEEATDALTAKDEEYLMEMLTRELPNTAISFNVGLEHLHQRKFVLNREREEIHLSSSSSSSSQGFNLV